MSEMENLLKWQKEMNFRCSKKIRDPPVLREDLDRISSVEEKNIHFDANEWRREKHFLSLDGIKF